MKYLILLVACLILSGCATPRKSDTDVTFEVASRLVGIVPPEQVAEFPVIKIPSHGHPADLLAIGVGGGANVGGVRRALQAAQKQGDKVFLMIGDNRLLDAVVLGRAVDGLHLPGMNIVYANSLPISNEAEVRARIESARANYIYVDL
jgi:hypothetical protein